MVFAILSAFGVQWVSRKKDVRKDSAIAMFWTLGMSVGIICCFLTPGFMPDLPSFLFGSILAIDSADLWLLGRTYPDCSPPVHLSAAPYPEHRIRQHLCQIAAPAGYSDRIRDDDAHRHDHRSNLKMVGIVLAISLLTIPQMTANLFTYSYKHMIGVSIVLGCIDCIVGLYASYLLNVPSGATIIFVSIILFAAARILAARKH